MIIKKKIIQGLIYIYRRYNFYMHFVLLYIGKMLKMRNCSFSVKRTTFQTVKNVKKAKKDKYNYKLNIYEIYNYKIYKSIC